MTDDRRDRLTRALHFEDDDHQSHREYYDLQDYPETPTSEDVFIEIEQLMMHRPAGTSTITEIVAAIVAYVETLDPSVRRELRREHALMRAHQEGVGHTADYVRLKADLKRSSETERWILDRLSDETPPRE